MAPDSVLLCTDYLPPGGGGVEAVVDRLARGLAERGVDAGVLTLADDTTPDLAGHPGVRVYEAPALDLTGVVGLQSRVAPRAVPALGRAVADLDPDVVHAHNRFFFTTAVAAAARATGRLGAPLVTTFHLGPTRDLGRLGGLAAGGYERTVGRAILRASDAAVAVSGAVADHVRTLGAAPDPTVVVPNGVDPETFRPPEGGRDPSGPPRVLFVGRLVRNKGPQVLVDALPAALDGHPDATVRVVGTGPMRERLIRRVERLGLADRVAFPGFVGSVAAEMRAADVFCRPSRSEGLPLTLLEAMASGLPPVVTPVAGVPEVVTDGETGRLVPPDDPGAVADALGDLLADADRRRRLGTAARAHAAEGYGWDRRTDRAVDLYARLLDDERAEAGP